jgi:hypothetical protein
MHSPTFPGVLPVGRQFVPYAGVGLPAHAESISDLVTSEMRRVAQVGGKRRRRSPALLVSCEALARVDTRTCSMTRTAAVVG